jgi:WD40 repeat protein
MSDPSWLRIFAGYLWGYDFFISYHWTSGGRYAVALAEALRARGYECFLDRSEFAAGDDWKIEARFALRRTQRLLVVATTEAVTTSMAVAHELEEFRSRNRPVILVVFGRRFEEHERAEYGALHLVPRDSLDVIETAEALGGEPSGEAVNEIVRSYDVLRRRALRSRWIAGVICVLAGLLLVSTFQTKRALDQRDEAEQQQRRAEDEAIGQAGQVLVIKARDANDEGLLPAAVELAERAFASERTPPSSVTQALAAAVSRPAYRVRVLRGPGSQAVRPIFTTAGRFVASPRDAAPGLWDAQTGKQIGTLGWHPALAVASDNGERILAYVNDVDVADLWDGRTGDFVAHIAGNGDAITGARFASNAQHVAILREHSVDLATVADGKVVRTLARDSAPLLSSSAQRHLAIFASGTLNLWELDTGTSTRSIEIEGRPNAIILSPGSKYVAVTSDDACTIWNLSTGARIGSFAIDNQQIVFSTDDNLVFSDIRGKLQVHASATAKLVQASEAEEVVDNVTAVPGGPYVLTTQWGGVTTLRDPYTMRTLFTAPDSMTEPGVFSQDGRWLLAVGGDLVARVWDVPAQRLIASLRGTDLLLGAAMSPDGSRIAITSYDGTIELWAITDGNTLTNATRRVGAPKVPGINRAIFAVDDAYIVTAAHDGTVATFDARNRKPIATFSAELSHAALTSRGELELDVASNESRVLAFASFGGGVDVWRLPDGGNHVAIRRKDVLSARFIGNGTHVLTTCTSGEAEIWDARTGERIRMFKHGDFVAAGVLSPDGKRLATGGDDTVKVWDLEDSEAPPLVISHVDVEDVAFSADGQQLLTYGDGFTSLWQLSAMSARSTDPWNQPRPIATVKAAYQFQGAARGLADTPLAMAFLPQGPRVLTQGYDRRLRLWDVAANRKLTTLEGPVVEANHAAFSKDGTRIVTASVDGIARLWDTDGRMLAAFGGHGGSVAAAALSADGLSLVTAGDDGTARIYPVTLEGLLAAACERVRNDISADESRCP